MQDFIYNDIKNKLGDKAEILLKDADSPMYKIEAENVYEDFYKNEELFDFSDYPNDSKYYNNSNNLIVVKMKDETCVLAYERFCRIKI